MARLTILPPTGSYSAKGLRLDHKGDKRFGKVLIGGGPRMTGNRPFSRIGESGVYGIPDPRNDILEMVRRFLQQRSAHTLRSI